MADHQQNAALPKRIQRRRTKGWLMPQGAIYVGRPSRWKNLWRIGLASCGCRSAGECHHNTFRAETAADAVMAFRLWLSFFRPARLEAYLAPLRGHDLACWCHLCTDHQDGLPLGTVCTACAPCHADFLLHLANDRPAPGTGAPAGRREIGDVLPPKLHNIGYSAGLEYPFSFREIGGQWLIWNRHTGVVAAIVVPDHPPNGMEICGKLCRKMNGMREPTAAETAAVNALHDMEP